MFLCDCTSVVLAEIYSQLYRIFPNNMPQPFQIYIISKNWNLAFIVTTLLLSHISVAFQSNWFIHSIQPTSVYSIHSFHFNLFDLLWSIQSTLVHFGLFSPFIPSVYSVHFNLFRSIRSTSIHLVHFGPFNSIRWYFRMRDLCKRCIVLKTRPTSSTGNRSDKNWKN